MPLFGKDSGAATKAQLDGDVGANPASRRNPAQQAAHTASKAWKAVIGYNDTEANRLGVPYVSSYDWLRDLVQSPGSRAVDYLDSIFPFTKWILSYNLQWFIGDLIAGLTVGLVVVPQSLSYAQVATLPLEYGLYSSFVGVVIYVLFATSKDVTIGPVAVMSLQTANVIRAVQDAAGEGVWSAPEIASALAFICGVITLGVGMARLGWLVEFIPTPAVAGFMTGSAFTIAAGQVPKLMGISGISTNGTPTYKIIIETLKGLPRTKVDAAFGLGTLVFLYATRSIASFVTRRYPRYARAAFFTSVFRNAFIIIILTAAVYGWLKNYPNPTRNAKMYPISLIGSVPSGFRHIQQPNLDPQLFSDMAGQIPVSVIILLLEHIAISKSFGRLNNYKINPNQELIAIGVTNMVGPTFGAYAATGSFSRSAIKNKSGVRTPLAGWITAIVVVVALYGVTGAFFWIPNAVLSAVIIHAVGDLIAPPSLLYRFWLVSPFEFFIWVAAVAVTIFSNVENGVYTSVGASLALLLIRIARPRGRWLGRVRIHYGQSTRQSPDDIGHRDVFVPLDDRDGLRDPSVRVDPPPPGILIYRFEEAFTYPNASHLADLFLDKVRDETRPGTSSMYKFPGDRPWNDPGPINPKFAKAGKLLTCGFAARRVDEKVNENHARAQGDHDTRPSLRAIIFDCSSVSNVDTTSVQCLADVRQSVERYSGRRIDFYFAGIASPWIRRALLAAGFGTGQTMTHLSEVAPVIGPRDQVHETYSHDEQLKHKSQAHPDDVEDGADRATQTSGGNKRRVRLQDGTATPTALGKYTNHQDAIVEDGSYDHNGSSAGGSSIDKDAPRDAVDDPLENSGASSNVSVPVIWNHDLTPFFYLDISAALAAATGSHD